MKNRTNLRRHSLSTAAVFTLMLLSSTFEAAPARAQSPPDAMLASGNEYAHRYARPGRATMTVYVWGSVGTPGVWEVERDADLVEVLSAASVPGLGTDQPGLSERVVLRVYRLQQAGGRRHQIYEDSLENLLQQGVQGPSLQAEDVLSIELRQKRTFNISTVAQYVGAASTLVVLGLQLFRN